MLIKIFYCIVLSFHSTYGELIDLSYDYEQGVTINWLTTTPFTMTVDKQEYTKDGYWYQSDSMCLGVHSGTHLDSPVHFYEHGYSVEQIPIENFIGPGVVIDIQEKVDKDRDYELSTDDVMAWLDEHGPLPNNSIVFVRTGWSKRYGNVIDYFGSTKVENTSFPGISPGASQILSGHEKVSGIRVVGVGIDGPSLDRGISKSPGSHIELSKENIYGLENVANLEKLPPTGAKIMVFPMKIKGTSGAPCRIIAEVDSNGASSGVPSSVGIYILVQLSYLIYIKLFHT